MTYKIYFQIYQTIRYYSWRTETPVIYRTLFKTDMRQVDLARASSQKI